MPSRFSKRQESSPEGRRRRSIRLTVPAAAALALVGAVVIGIRLGNGAIGDINPVHFRGAAIHPRDRGAAVPEQRHRQRAPAYAALHGWDEGRAARAGPVGEAAQIDGFEEAAIEARPAAAQREPPGEVRVAIHHGSDRADRDRYLVEQEPEEQALDAKRRERMRRYFGDERSAIDDADF